MVAPVTTSGFVGNTVRSRQFAEDPRTVTERLELTVNAATYIWQPWFITVLGEGDLAFEIESGSVSSDGNSLLAAGGVDFGILPVSNFPATLSLQHTDTRASGEFVTFNSVSDRVSVQTRQHYSSDLQTTAGVSYQRTTEANFGVEERNRLELGVNKTFDTDRLALSVSLQSDDFASERDEDETSQTAVGTLTYDAVPLEKVFTQSNSSVVREHIDAKNEAFDRLSLQGFSTAQWRPEEYTFTVNGALRTFTETIEFSRIGSGLSNLRTEEQLFSGTLGLNYPILPRLTANVATTGQFQAQERDAGAISGEANGGSFDRSSASLLGNLNYVSEPSPFGGFEWLWRTNGNLNQTFSSDTGFSDSESVAAGHGLSRNVTLGFLDPIRVSFDQDGTFAHSSADGFVPSLFHGANFSHNKAVDGIVTFVRLSLNDRRELAGEQQQELQQVQFQLNRESRVDLTSSWTAGLSAQITRQKSSEDTDISASANGTVGYRNGEVFGVENLFFTSDLSISAFGLEEVLRRNEEDGLRRSDRFSGDFRNRIGYRIGRLVASLEGTAFLTQGALGNLLLFRVRREFGDVLR